jgi:putative ABC transport system permease protein
VDPIGVAVSVVLLLAVTVAVLRWARVPLATSAIIAVARGAGQLALVSVLLGVALNQTWAGIVILAVMFTTAIVTASRRLREFSRPVPAVAVAILSGMTVTLVIVFATGAFDFSVRYVLAFAGIVIGGSMTAASTTGRQLWIGMVHRTDEVEGWLALGATPRQSVLDIARSAVVESMRPAIDQTKTTGLVTLPGAFVGALLAGASPIDAGIFQVTVLAGLLAARSVSAVATAYLLGAPAVLPAR